ncbi:hypothetical protein ACG83_21925 [Frankia sp. R43]|uniref:hypothetical protein n=1 Tax=Frankia sp. R43 TaxID=269536 RepID=UPI0006CA1C4F|nr:hypothetical protein [Frankia sp. R43]KPM53382.1 hypothetical protein ACG83_21925 [Frankia sp. R43]
MSGEKTSRRQTVVIWLALVSLSVVVSAVVSASTLVVLTVVDRALSGPGVSVSVPTSGEVGVSW